MASDGQIVFEVTADGRHAIADIQDITRAIQQETRRWDNEVDQSANHMSDSFSGMLKKVAAGFSAAKIGKALLDLGKDAIEAASDLQEVQNVVDVTFGSGASQIESWAKKAGTQFGLTETQAKRFTSTIGAMMKSSGMAGDEIVQMSTDLAGLAADMASFYNLDFEEAFSKIRSGISGQTMPLKELGIDLSVATLNAYALQKGLKKSFDEMSQAEQTMLRYEYLMQATADAQGDFARTSDGFANGVRKMETSLTTLKTNLGSVLLEYINPLLEGINRLFPEEYKNDSILAKVSEVQLQKDEKIAEIDAIAEVAEQLIATLETIGTDKNASTTLGNIATSANSLDASSKGNWEALLSSLQGIDGLQNLFGSGNNAVGTVEDLAAALSNDGVTSTRADAWKTFLGALADNADAVSALTGESVGDTKAWLEGMAQAAGELDPTDAAAWNTLMTSLMQGITAGQSEEGKRFIEQLTQNFLALGSDSEAAANGLASLGYTTDEIEEKQAAWLRTCQELVKTIPGLSSIIDSNTGEVKGGIPALRAYADEWERAAKYQAEIDALKSAKDIYNANNNQATLNADVTAKRAVAYAKMVTSAHNKGLLYQDDLIRDDLIALGEFMAQLADQGETSWDKVKADYFSANTKFPEELQGFVSAKGEEAEAIEAYAEAAFRAALIEKERPVVLAEIEAEEARVAEEYGVTTDEIDAQTEALADAQKELTKYEKALSGDADAQTEFATAVDNATESLKAMADYAEKVRENVESAIDSVVHGFDAVDYHTYKQISDNIDKISGSLEGLEAGSDEWEKQHKELEKYNNQLITTGTIYKNLESQQTFLADYLANLSKAQTMGLNAQLLAELSDGSVESAMYLDALVNDTKGGYTVEQINALYDDIQKKKQALSGTLSDNQLSVDQVYQNLVADAKKAVDELGTLGAPAADNAKAMVDAIAAGVGEEEGQVKTAVDGIIAQLDRLSSLSFAPTITLGLSGLFAAFFHPHETGLDRVPYDGYLAQLHEGEGILTAEENRVWQRFKTGQGKDAIDYDTMGGVMRDNIKAGGNVYLDGQVVGSVISAQQGKTYRQLQRSGWQA